jgi:hypothetical protein
VTHTADDQTADLREIGARLGSAIRRDSRRRARRRSVARGAALVLAVSAGISGSALATGALTGVVDLGGGHRASRITRTPAPVDPRLPYRYRLIGFHKHDSAGGNGTIFIESDRPLSAARQATLAAARVTCRPKTTTVDGATIWIFDAGCTLARP